MTIHKCRNLERSCITVLLAMAVVSLTVTGCGTLNNGRGWGQDAIYPVEMKRIPRTTYNAFFDLQTLVPAAGALIFAIDDFDEKISDWTSEYHPIFGSKQSAKNASDYLTYGLCAETLLTALASRSGDNPKNWAYSKLKGVGVEGVSWIATSGATGLLKVVVDRPRPNGSSNSSFPSHHSSSAFSSAALTNRNLNCIPLPGKVRFPLQIGNILVATSVAWARVEAGKHFPSDVLVGAALGHFLTAFLYEAFMGLKEDRRFGFIIFPLEAGGMATVYFIF